MTRNVVISGGGTGIGLAVARVFAAGGDRVLLVGRRKEVLERAGVSGALVCAADLGGVEGVREVAQVVDRELGGVDVLVHGAGGNGGLEPRSGSSDPLEVVAHEWGVNFRSNTLTAVLLTEALKERVSSGGRVLFVSSIAAYRGSGSGAYAASKAALHPYAHDLARQLGPRGITVNVVAPGYIEDTEFFGGAMAEERRERLVGETSNGRAGTPEDVAGTLYWLASAGAGHVTSQVVQVNGGAERGH
ncbi:SDR family NAD(P)-dependent oxidoreductase [Streptomyces acidiscabies]|uniref:Oxidoreductase n=1 Tax=Streptomyces acidiscabies TaxID=42234 RepID=A0A0L0KLJ1_9ACTN|nr:SDR family oxidoreductase [Streptomyces acidiscabies]KND38713.1 oxidoreductase [Streptomyces acidiscabies]